MRCELRIRAYQWFASFFAAELDETGWGRYQEAAVVEMLHRELEELGLSTEAHALLGYIRAHRSEPKQVVVSELMIDFSKLFCGPGGGLAPPFESFYSESIPRYFGESHADVVRLVEEQRLRLPSDWTMPADHVAIELDLVAQSLVHETIPKAGEDGPSNRLAPSFRHWQARVAQWLPRWCRDVQNRAVTGFYRSGAALLDAFIRTEVSQADSTLSGDFIGS